MSCTRCHSQSDGHETVDHPYRMEVDTGDRTWNSNALTFATEADATAWAIDLMGRWMMVRDYRVVPVTTPEQEVVTR